MKDTGKMPAAKTVDEYISRLPAEQLATLEKMRKAIEDTCPKAEEMMNYGVPYYKYLGPLICFGAYPKHLSLYAVSKRLLAYYAAELKPFKIAGTTIHFTPEKPVPLTLLKKIVKDRMKDNEERTALKAVTKKSTTKKRVVKEAAVKKAATKKVATKKVATKKSS